MTTRKNSFGAQAVLNTGEATYTYFRLAELDRQGWTQLGRFPVSIKILLENLLRHEDGEVITARAIEATLSYGSSGTGGAPQEIPFMPARVLLQDFTGVPAVVDLAAMRDAMRQLGGDPDRINPLVRSDLVIDHSVQVDVYGTPEARALNEKKEYERNRERYSLLRWAQGAFRNFTVVPPGTGIVHQVNLEYLASVVQVSPEGSERTAYPDTVVGTDSHTTMINGLGVLGWGVGGIEAEAVMLGQPYYMPLPEVVGVRLTGALRRGVTATDLVLQLTQMLRKKQVVAKFVEFYGPGLGALSLPDRATVANMAPEYGATMGFFPVDDKTLTYLRLTGRAEPLIQLVEHYTKEQGLYWAEQSPEPIFSDTLELNLGEVEPNLAGPKRPQDRVPLSRVQTDFQTALHQPTAQGGFGVAVTEQGHPTVAPERADSGVTHGSVVIAAITSCTNTSNPAVMVAAGLLARKALERGIRSKPWVKTSLAPGSRVVTDYLEASGLMKPLEAQGFHLVGYGCTTCIGNSGPLPDAVQKAVDEGNLVVASVLSGNRNFEGRIHSAVKANYLASPPLVVAYALAGTLDIDFEKMPIGQDERGEPVFLRDLWPDDAEVAQVVQSSIDRGRFLDRYQDVYAGDETWRHLPVPEGGVYAWDDQSTYIRRPPFFEDLSLDVPPITNIEGARVLAYFGDSTTTDHISPAGSIPPNSPAGLYLRAQGIEPKDFNSYGSRRGNHEVMIRGTFANIRIRNKLLDDVAGGYTRHFPSNEQLTIWDASELYRREGVSLIVLAGKEYGTGSSRDWAAKGTRLLGVRAVIAESFERIHRNNLIGMGVLPLQFANETSAQSLGLTGRETYALRNLSERMKAEDRRIPVEVIRPDGSKSSFEALIRLDTPIEVEYYRNGGILPKVLRDLVARSRA